MGKQFVLYTQQPKPKEIGVGVLSIDRNGEAHFFSGNGEQGCTLLADMTRARIDFAAANGIMVSGFEPCGFERNGKTKYRYQEWWLEFEEHPRAESVGECRRCGCEMKPSKAIAPTFTGIPDFAGGEVVTVSPGGPGRLVDCLKCEKCGWSVTATVED